MSGRNDEVTDLFRAAIDGDAKAYADFLAAIVHPIRSHVRGRLQNTGVDPEDIVQETLLAVHLKQHTWRKDAPAMPWVLAIARYKMIDALRRRGHRVEIGLDAIAETSAAPQNEAPMQRDVDRALALLTAGQRDVVRAISVEGFSIRETSARLGMTETAVRVALHRGLQAIARRFGRA